MEGQVQLTHAHPSPLFLNIHMAGGKYGAEALRWSGGDGTDPSGHKEGASMWGTPSVTWRGGFLGPSFPLSIFRLLVGVDEDWVEPGYICRVLSEFVSGVSH